MKSLWRSSSGACYRGAMRNVFAAVFVSLLIVFCIGCGPRGRRGGGPFDAGDTDSAMLDAGSDDLGVEDDLGGEVDLGGDLDLGTFDLGPVDLGGVDLGPIDMGRDLGPIDMGRDLGPVDMGRVDLGGIRSVLVFHDDPDTECGVAITARAGTPILTETGASFALAFDAGGFSIVVIESSNDDLPAEVLSRLPGWISGGGAVIFSYWALDASAPMRAALGVSCVSFDTAPSVYRDASTVDLFGAPSPFTSPIVPTDLVSDSGDQLTLSGTGFLAARFTSASGSGAIAVTNTRRVVVNGFMPSAEFIGDSDFDGLSDALELYINELALLGL